MSVINQMLKALDNRQQAHQVSNLGSIPREFKGRNSPWLVLFVVFLCVAFIGCAIVGYFWWQEKQAQFEAEIALLKQLQAKESAALVKLGEVEQLKKIPLSPQSHTEQPVADKKQINETNKSEVASHDDDKAEITLNLSAGVVSSRSTLSTPEVDKDIVDSHTQKSSGSIAITPVRLTAAQLADKWVQMAESAEQHGDFESAEKQYIRVLELLPSRHVVREKLAALYYGQGKLEPAITLLEEGAVLYPRYAGYPLLLAKIQQVNGDLTGALDTLNAIPDNSDRVIDKWVHQGDLAQKLKKFEIAEQAYRNLLGRESNQARWWMGLAYAVDAQGRYAEAAKIYKTALGKAGLSPQANQYIESRLAQLGANE